MLQCDATQEATLWNRTALAGRDRDLSADIVVGTSLA